MSNATGPIADLSYRTYEGPLDPPTQRWKVIARANIMRVIKNKWYWVCLLASGWYYGFMMIILVFLDSMLSASPGQARQALEQLGGIDWTMQFLHGYSYGQHFILFAAMIAGTGAIANDNRTNALLVYLSKPCTKRDYLWGKWVGVFVPVLVAILIPALFFYAYGAMNYRSFGFISDDPWLIFRVFAFSLLGAGFHASLVLGVSSMFNQGRMAGAAYVGAYFILYFVTVLIGVILSDAHGASRGMTSFTELLFYCSIGGLNMGMAKVFLDVDYGPIFVGAGRGSFEVDRPTPWIAIGLVVLLSVLALRLVWRRVRAVEVVG
jgi:ABC-2 type transport system permease protein